MRRSVSLYVDVDVAEVLCDMDDECLREECRKRGIKFEPDAPARTDARFADAIVEMEYEFDTLVHEMREAFLSRDARHFEVLISRMEGRYRDAVTVSIARERVTA